MELAPHKNTQSIKPLRRSHSQDVSRTATRNSTRRASSCPPSISSIKFNSYKKYLQPVFHDSTPEAGGCYEVLDEGVKGAVRMIPGFRENFSTLEEALKFLRIIFTEEALENLVHSFQSAAATLPFFDFEEYRRIRITVGELALTMLEDVFREHERFLQNIDEQNKVNETKEKSTEQLEEGEEESEVNAFTKLSSSIQFIITPNFTTPAKVKDQEIKGQESIARHTTLNSHLDNSFFEECLIGLPPMFDPSEQIDTSTAAMRTLVHATRRSSLDSFKLDGIFPPAARNELFHPRIPTFYLSNQLTTGLAHVLAVKPRVAGVQSDPVMFFLFVIDIRSLMFDEKGIEKFEIEGVEKFRVKKFSEIEAQKLYNKNMHKTIKYTSDSTEIKIGPCCKPLTLLLGQEGTNPTQIGFTSKRAWDWLTRSLAKIIEVEE